MSILFQCARGWPNPEPKCSLHLACCSSAIRVNVGQEALEHLHFPYTPQTKSFLLALPYVLWTNPLDWMYQHHNLDDSKYTQNMTASHHIHSSCSPNKHSSKWDPLRNINRSMSHLCSSHFPCSIRPCMRSNIYEEHIYTKESNILFSFH